MKLLRYGCFLGPRRTARRSQAEAGRATQEDALAAVQASAEQLQLSARAMVTAASARCGETDRGRVAGCGIQGRDVL